MTKTIDITPTFAATSTMLRAVIENGTDEGRQDAFEEIARWGRMLDRLVAERRKHSKILRKVRAETIKEALKDDGHSYDEYHMELIESIIADMEV